MSATDNLSMPRLGLAVLDRLAAIKADGRLVLVTSARKGEGKSFVAHALARQFAALGAGSVLLVDGHIAAKPKGEAVGGFAGLLAAGELADDAVRSSERSGLGLLPAGQGGADAEQLLFRPGPVSRALQALRQSHDLVVFDGPSLAACGALALLTDATVLVIDAQRSSGRAVQDALLASRLPEKQVAGVVINRQPGYLARWFGG